ncbi:MAG: hypothetical protein IPL53_06740 [Ignavibacteria bacterium]|nr:hypothetical protein [Ignavibacteria bacterium]
MIADFNDHSDSADFKLINFDSKPQPDFHSNLKGIYQNLCENIKNGYEAFVLASDEHQAGRIKELIEDFEDENIIEQDEKIHSDAEEDSDEIKSDPEFSIKNKFK